MVICEEPMRILSGLSVLSFLILFLQPAQAESDLEKGKRIFVKCAACHSINPGSHRTGPSLFNVVNRMAGTEVGYWYSKAMLAKKEEGFVWTEEHLDAFLTKPQRYIRLTKMSYKGLKDPADRAAVIAYLKTHSD